MEEHYLFPTDASQTVPESILQVKFGTANVNHGNILTPKQVAAIPNVYWEFQQNSYYTLIMIDPDAPSQMNPTFHSVLHWLVVNIPGNDIAKGRTLTEFLSSAPGVNTSFHRYTFLLYKQTGIEPLQFHEAILTKDSIEGRKCFSVQEFAEKYALGKPIARNFYTAEWDEFVVDIRKQRGLGP